MSEQRPTLDYLHARVGPRHDWRIVERMWGIFLIALSIVVGLIGTVGIATMIALTFFPNAFGEDFRPPVWQIFLVTALYVVMLALSFAAMRYGRRTLSR